MAEITIFQKVSDIPPAWDELAVNYFQQTGFLLHAEKYNPCHQRYYLYKESGTLLAVAIVYSLQLDILTFIRVKSPLKMNIIGIPCSVSSSGIFGKPEANEKLKKYIYEKEKGFVLALNLEEKPAESAYTSGKTLPSIILDNKFKSWNGYLSSLRSDYRRRIRIINSPDDLKFEEMPCSEFTEVMHMLYLEVYKRSSGKLEKLGFEFFKNLPSEFKLVSCSLNKEVIGWNIGLKHNSAYYFFLGGIDYEMNKRYSTYFRLLTMITRNGIESGAQMIDLGQTAEIPKMRMGGKPVSKYMEAHHSNSFFNYLLKKFSNLLEYKREFGNSHPFKQENL